MKKIPKSVSLYVELSAKVEPVHLPISVPKITVYFSQNVKSANEEKKINDIQWKSNDIQSYLFMREKHFPKPFLSVC